MSAAEITRLDARALGERLASMEPRHVCRGNDAYATPEAPEVQASMEPRHVCRGNDGDSLEREAVEKALQWSRGMSAAEMPPRQPSGNTA